MHLMHVMRRYVHVYQLSNHILSTHSVPRFSLLDIIVVVQRNKPQRRVDVEICTHATQSIRLSTPAKRGKATRDALMMILSI
jgi:hypothetical protein